MVTSDRLSAFDVVMDEPIPHKGRVLTAISAFWFEALGDVAGSHLVSTDVADLPAERRRRRPRPGRPDHAVPQGRDAPDRVHRARLPLRLGVEGVPGQRHDARPGPARRAAGERPAARAGVHAVDQERRARREHLLRASRRPRRARSWPTRARDISLELYRRGAAMARERGIIIADTKFELGPGRRRAGAVRRGADARLQPLLARRRVEAGHHAAELRQAAGARLPRRPRLGQDPAAAAAARRGRARPRAQRYIEAYERITGRDFRAWPGVA